MCEERIINCTPHDVCIFDENDVEFSIEKKAFVLKAHDIKPVQVFPSGIDKVPARVKVEETFSRTICGIPVRKTKFSDVEDLLPEAENTFYIVSAIVGKAGARMGRTDLLVPSRQVRNEKGMVIGCTGFAEAEA